MSKVFISAFCYDSRVERLKVKINGIGIALPPGRVTSAQLEKNIRRHSWFMAPLKNGTVERLTGIRERRKLEPHLDASYLAAEAGKAALLDANLTPSDIDCLIFAAASSDIAEPATANLVQVALGATCPVFDIKNACNSFVSGIEVAEALLLSGKYKKILVTNGEVPSRVVRTSVRGVAALKKAFAGYTLGDAGAAMVLGISDDESGILTSRFATYGEHWHLSAVLGGGVRHPRDPDKGYFEGHTSGLKQVFIDIGPKQIHEVLSLVGWTFDDVDCVVAHQVSMRSFDHLAREAKIPKEKMMIVLPDLGNMVSASIPVALYHAREEGRIQKGSKVVLIGLASGVSMSTTALIW